MTENFNPDSAGTVLIVDDNPNNLRVLGSMLERAGYQVRPARGGTMALRFLESQSADLILLDIRMPDIDGYEVCRRIKLRSTTRDLPVIFISALQEETDKLNAFSAGGVDYVTKPFQEGEVLARAKTHITLFRTRRALARANAELETHVSERTQELKTSHTRLELAMQLERALTALLKISLRVTLISTYLEESLQALGSHLETMGLPQKNALFLIQQNGGCDALQLAASTGFSDAEKESCYNLASGAGACGEVLDTKLLNFFDADISYPCSSNFVTAVPRYCIPICFADKKLGSLTQFLPFGWVRDDVFEAFFERVADVLSTGIQRRHATSRLEHLAYHDALTELGNQHMLTERLGQEVARANRHYESLAVLFIDIDRFKNINDVLGHTAGDLFICETARRIRAILRPEDTVARWGGDEFVILLPSLGTDLQQSMTRARRVSTKLREEVAKPQTIMGHKLRLSACVGIALFPNDGDNRSLLIQRADTALSKAKEIGRDNDCFFETTMQEAVERRVVMEKDLRHALEVNQLVLHYQAQVNTTRQLIGVEALVRWQHPERGLISPAEFIPLAEESGLILPLGQWVMEAALLQLRSWQEQGLTPLPRMAINVSSHQFHQPDFVETVQATINRVGVPPEWVELEVTESLMLDNVESAAHKLTRLKKLGVQFAIDDFGTGYSSLAYLKRLPLDRLKIDRSFIHEAHLDTQSAAIVNAILSLAKSLGLEAIAEGVETDGEFEFLRDAGCQYFQGFYLARPQPADQFALKLGGSRARQ